MKLGDAIELTVTFLKEGISVQLIPTEFQDKEALSANVILPEITVSDKQLLEYWVKWADHYECEVFMKDSTVIYQ